MTHSWPLKPISGIFRTFLFIFNRKNLISFPNLVKFRRFSKISKFFQFYFHFSTCVWIQIHVVKMSHQMSGKTGKKLCISICIDQKSASSKSHGKRSRSNSKTKGPVHQKPKTYEELVAEAEEYDQLISGKLDESLVPVFKPEESFLSQYMMPPTARMTSSTLKK